MIPHKFNLIKTSQKLLALIILKDYHKYIFYSVVAPDTNPANNWQNPKINTSPKDRLDLVLSGNLDPLLIWKQEPQYKEDDTVNYGILLDKSKDESHRKSDKFEVL